MGKAEGAPLITDKMPWHGHVTAVTVDPDYRRLGLADGLMHGLEEISEKTHNAFFVDLFVRVSNTVAVSAPPRPRQFAVLRRQPACVPRADQHVQEVWIQCVPAGGGLLFRPEL